MKTLLPSAALLLFAGCAQSLFNQSFLSSSFMSNSGMEHRVIQQFTDAVTEENESALRKSASTSFEQKAMTSDDALTDLRAVDLPTGEISVIEVKETDKTHREVIVKEMAGGKYQFQLVKDGKKGYWVVDDVLIRQKGKGMRVTRSATEVMDLLRTLRQFLDVWAEGNPENILAMTSPAMTKSLQPLPTDWLKTLTATTASSYEDGMARKPEANLTESDAIVKLPARNGHLMMKIIRGTDGWLIDDVEVRNHRAENHPGSVRRQADAITAVTTFLAAYKANDREQLQLITDKNLYNRSLKAADLDLVTLPDANDVPDEYDIRAYESRLTFMIPAGREIVRLDLKEREDIGTNPTSTAERFLVDDVTLYDRGTKKQRTLSAVFTAPTRAALFLKALAERDMEVLSHISTSEFARATWKRVTPELLAELPIPEFLAEGIQLTGSHDVADITELEFTNRDGLMFSCRLVNENGGLKVDDVQFPNSNAQITSLRTQLELAVPVQEFALAWSKQDLPLLQRSCSTDFNRLVWSHLDRLPARFSAVPSLMNTPITDTHVTLERATVQLKDPTSGSSVTVNLVTEHNYWVVDEVRLEANQGPAIAIRAKLRGEIADKLLSGSYSLVRSQDGTDRIAPVRNNPNGIQQASAEAHDNETFVQPAVFERDIVDDQQDRRRPAPVSPAVRTMEYHDTPSGAKGHDRTMKSSTPRTAGGVQMFGPQAAVMAKSMERPKTKTNRLQQPIDMTEDTSFDRPPVPNPKIPATTTGAEEPGYLYFGPDEAGSDDASTTADSSTRADASTAPRRIAEPADAPIAIQ